MRYEYDFIRLKLQGFWTHRPREDYHQIIHERAKEGWRLVQIFAPATSGYGIATYFDLIFERPMREETGAT